MSRLEDAFNKVPRVKFLPDNMKDKAELDMPLSIGFSQTNSQPSTVEQMLKWLDPIKGNNVLDVGSGSGWTSGLLSYLVGKDGKVTSVERVPELVEFGKQNCNKLNMKNVSFYKASNYFGWKENAPYDRILVSASAEELPNELLDQLQSPGKLVIPVKNDILVITKDSKGNIDVQENPGFIFVPLINNNID